MLCPAKNQFENNEYEILDGTTDIRSWAFSNCTSLNKIIMPNSVQTIGDSSFLIALILTRLFYQKILTLWVTAHLAV